MGSTIFRDAAVRCVYVNNTKNLPHVVIVGAGFAGVAAAKSLKKSPVRITLLDKENHHLFQPLLYQVATAGLNPADIARPTRRMFRKQANCTVQMRTVERIDVAAKTVFCEDEAAISYDYLVVATGSTHAYFGNEHWETNAPGLKTLKDALDIRGKIFSAFEQAELETDPEKIAALLTFVVVGGGPTGVEMAGSIAEIARSSMKRDFRSIDPTNARILLIEAGDSVLSTFTPKLSASAEKQLKEIGVDVITSTRVTDVAATHVETTSLGRIDCETVIWAAGVAASPLGTSLDGAELDRSGRVAVADDLTLPGYPNVFVVGDLASKKSKGKPVPAVAPAASQGGAFAADCIKRDLEGEERKVFRYKDKGSLATIGRSAAIADLGRGRKFKGWFAWVLCWAIHILFLIDFRSKFYVMFGWAWQYLTFQRSARLISEHAQRDEKS